MQNQIISKLGSILSNEIKSEPEVVYILSRIRKIWETMGKPYKYNKLIFYCDWALHTNIDSTGRVEDELRQFIDNVFENDFIDFKHFRNEFKVFLEEFNLPKYIVEENEKFNNFRKILIDIYSDTPLYLRGNINKKITLNESTYTTKNQHYGVGFSIESI